MADEDKKDVDDAEEIKDEDDIGDESGDSEGEEGEGGKAKKKKAKKSGSGMMTILLAAGIPTVLILILAVVLFFTSFGRGLIGLEEGDAKHGEGEAVVKLPEHITYYEMPELLVNIQTSSSKRKPYLRLAVKFEIHDPEAIKTLDLIKPRIIDAFQVYLRELRVDDLEGSIGSQRLKEELLKRVNTVAAPVKVIDVLFQVFVIQ